MIHALTLQLAAIHKTNIDATLAAANVAFASAERMAAHNLGIAHGAVEETMGNARALLAAKDMQELSQLQSATARPSLEKALAYTRGMYDIATGMQQELTRIFEAQCTELNDTVAETLDKAAKHAPAGSDIAFAAVKSAMAAANSAYDTMSKSARQATEIAEANVAAATGAAVRSIGTAAPKARKAA